MSRAAVDSEHVLGLAADLDCDLDQLSDRDVIAALEELETHRRQLAALEHRLCAQVTSRHIGNVATEDNLAGLLLSTLRLTRADARERAACATDLGPRSTLIGQPLPPILPACAEAVRDGAISSAHVRIISATMDKVPTDQSPGAFAAIERLLVDAARRETPRQLQRTANYVLQRLDQDGPEPDDEFLDVRRGLTMRHHHAGRHDGMTELRGWLTPETAALLDAVFDALAAPARSSDGQRDERTPEQRCHDALRDAAQRLLRSGTLPDTGGTPVTLLVRVTPDDLPETSSAGAGVGGWGFGITAHGQLIRLQRLARLGLAEADVIPVRVDANGAVLNLGRAQRLASCAQRRALAVRDGGCCFPGCDRPATWCQVHHVIEWVTGGRTDLNNLCLLCPFHHRTFAEAGWVVRIRDGVPEWTPPEWLDPERRPRRNTAHHPPDITFREPVPG